MTDDDRITCRQCGELRGTDRGDMVCRSRLVNGRAQQHAPVLDLKRRCEGFRPLRHADDKRTGLQRWPGLVQDQKARAA